MGIFPNLRGENKKYVKPPPRQVCYHFGIPSSTRKKVGHSLSAGTGLWQSFSSQGAVLEANVVALRLQTPCPRGATWGQCIRLIPWIKVFQRPTFQICIVQTHKPALSTVQEELYLAESSPNISKSEYSTDQDELFPPIFPGWKMLFCCVSTSLYLSPLSVVEKNPLLQRLRGHSWTTSWCLFQTLTEITFRLMPRGPRPRPRDHLTTRW